MPMRSRRSWSAPKLLALCACVSQCRSQGEDPPVAEAPVERPAEVEEARAQTPTVGEDGEIVSAVQWFDGDFEGALARALKERKLVFVEFGAYWCSPCHKLEEEVFSRAEVGEHVGRGYVAVRVDADAREAKELLERYHVQAYPTILVLEPTGVEKGRVVDFVPAADLLAALDRIARGENVLQGLEQEVELDPDDVPKRYELARAYAMSAKREDADAKYRDVLLADPTNTLGFASKTMFDRALFLTYKLDKKPEEAIRQFRELQARFPTSREAVTAHRQIGRIQHELGRDAEAIASLERMVAKSPDDVDLRLSFGWFAFRERFAEKPALKALDGAIELDAKNAELHYVSAELNHLLGQDRVALDQIRRAATLEPNNAFYRRQSRRFESFAHPRPTP